MRSHRITGRAFPIALIICLLLAAGATSGMCAGPGKQALADTQEWSQLARLWQTLLDHSSNQVYNPTLFQSLAAEVNATDAELAALANRGALPKPVANYLRELFHARYQYLGEVQYTARSSVTATPVEASRHAALWVIELQLSVLRRPVQSRADEELARAAESNIAYQLTYLYNLDKFEAEVDRRRMELKKRADAGEKIDFKPFDTDVERREKRLLDAYKLRDLPGVPLVKQAMPYIVALTRQEPSPNGAAPAGP
jgi:hypothetical protein